jgi:hypothetical protein
MKLLFALLTLLSMSSPIIVNGNDNLALLALAAGGGAPSIEAMFDQFKMTPGMEFFQNFDNALEARLFMDTLRNGLGDGDDDYDDDYYYSDDAGPSPAAAHLFSRAPRRMFRASRRAPVRAAAAMRRRSFPSVAVNHVFANRDGVDIFTPRRRRRYSMFG